MFLLRFVPRLTLKELSDYGVILAHDSSFWSASKDLTPGFIYFVSNLVFPHAAKWRLKMFQCHPVSICRVWQAGVYCRYCDVSDRPSPDEAQCCLRLDVPNPVIWLKDPVGDDKFPSTSMMYLGLAIQPASNMSMSMVFTLYRGPVTNIVVLNTPTMDVGDLLPTAVVPWMRLVT